MSLDVYLKGLESQKFLKRENIGNDQVKALLVSALRNISAAEKNLSIDEETCYSLAYTSMLKTSRALVYLQGYRPSDGRQHKTTVEVARKILGKGFDDLIEKFDLMRRKRNQFTYDPMLPLSLVEAINALKTAEKYHAKVKIFLYKKYAQLKLFE